MDILRSGLEHTGHGFSASIQWMWLLSLSVDSILMTQPCPQQETVWWAQVGPTNHIRPHNIIDTPGWEGNSLMKVWLVDCVNQYSFLSKPGFSIVMQGPQLLCRRSSAFEENGGITQREGYFTDVYWNKMQRRTCNRRAVNPFLFVFVSKQL